MREDRVFVLVLNVNTAPITPYKMQLKSILNKVEKQKGFVYSNVQWADGEAPAIWVTLKPHGRSKPVCSGCGMKRSCYDRREEREFQFIPLWGIPVFFYYAMRRVNCPDCGVVVESVPWCNGKERTTKSFRVFLASWARSLVYSCDAFKDRTDEAAGTNVA